MGIVEWAKNELDRLLGDDDDGMQARINEDVLEVIKVFANQGHSGFSASYARSLINRLLERKPITELAGEEDEWNPVPHWDTGEMLQQNKRCSAVFRKNFDNATAYYVDGKVFSDDGGKSWYTNSKSFVPVTFPYLVPNEPEYVIFAEGEAE